MPAPTQGTTAPQQQWSASLLANLERETGRSLDAWAALARDCPQTGQRARLAWLKATHGLGQNRGMLVLKAAFPAEAEADDPLWAEPGSAAVLEAVRTALAGLEGVVVGRRKGFTPFSHRHQFAALRPLKGGGARLGLALPAEADARLRPRGAESWSERLTASLDLPDAAAVDAEVAALLRRARETP